MAEKTSNFGHKNCTTLDIHRDFFLYGFAFWDLDLPQVCLTGELFWASSPLFLPALLRAASWLAQISSDCKALRASESEVLFTWSPTRIFLVRAPSGKIAWTWGTTVELTIPPSGPTPCTSWRILVTMAKYWGKSVVRIRVIRLVFRSSKALSSEKFETFYINTLPTTLVKSCITQACPLLTRKNKFKNFPDRTF